MKCLNCKYFYLDEDSIQQENCEIHGEIITNNPADENNCINYEE